MGNVLSLGVCGGWEETLVLEKKLKWWFFLKGSMTQCHVFIFEKVMRWPSGYKPSVSVKGIS
jgi:hypothetical protein